MPSKKKKYNARFPPARIKKIMQMDEEVGKVAATVPVIISRALELFIESLVQQATKMTMARNAKTLSSSHLKHIIESHEKYRFLRELVANVSDHQGEEEGGGKEGGAPIPTPTVTTTITNHSQEEESGSSTAPTGKRPRGRPRKSKEAMPAPPKRERKKRKKESSSSESENTEDTEDADEGTEEESEPVARPVVSLPPTPLAANCEPTDLSMPRPDTTTTTPSHPPPVAQLLTRSQEDGLPPQPQEVSSASVDCGQAAPQQEAPVSFPLESVASTFQAAPTAAAMMGAAMPMPMYQNMDGVPAPSVFAWPGPGGLLAGGFPFLPAQSPAFPALQTLQPPLSSQGPAGHPQSPAFPALQTQAPMQNPAFSALQTQSPTQNPAFPALQTQAPCFPGMMLPGIHFPAMPPSLMTFPSLPGMGFPAMSPLATGYPAVNFAAGGGLAAMAGKVPTAAATPNGNQGDDDYDT